MDERKMGRRKWNLSSFSPFSCHQSFLTATTFAPLTLRPVSCRILALLPLMRYAIRQGVETCVFPAVFSMVTKTCAISMDNTFYTMRCTKSPKNARKSSFWANPGKNPLSVLCLAVWVIWLSGLGSAKADQCPPYEEMAKERRQRPRFGPQRCGPDGRLKRDFLGRKPLADKQLGRCEHGPREPSCFSGWGTLEFAGQDRLKVELRTAGHSPRFWPAIRMT